MINLFCDQSWCRFIFKLINQIINQQEYKKFIKIMEVLQMGAHSAKNNKISNTSDIQLSEIPAQTLQIVKRVLREDLNQRQIKKPLINRASILFINPSSFKISIWNFIIIFTAYFIQFGLSLTLAFGPSFWSTQIEGTVYMNWYIVLLVLLFLDILVNLNKGYYAFGFGAIIDDRSLIIKKYLRGYFIMDSICLALLIIPLFISGYIVNYIQLISIVLLVFKKFKCQAQITRNLQYYQMLRIVFTLGMLGCDVMLLGHFGACVFLGIDLLLWRLQYFGNNQQYYWLSNNSMYSSIDLMGGPQIVQYVYAQSFSTGTLSTLAPGPFGKNFIEISIQLFIMTYFMILASYVAQVLIVTFYNKQMVRIFHDKNIGQFDHFLALKGVLQQTKRRVHGFFQLIWQLQVKNQTELQKASINKLPLTIRQNLLYQMSFSNQLKFVKYFSLNVQREIQKAISFKIKSYIVDPNTTIFQIGPVVDSKGQAFIYNMKTGLAKYYLPFGKFMHIISLSNLRKITGEYEYFTGLSHAYCGKSIDLSFVQKISFSDLTSIIKSLNLQEQYFIMRFQIMLYNKMDIIERRCLICNQKHRQNCCTLISMHDDATQKLKKQQKMPIWQQNRRIYHRNKSRLHPRIPSKADSQLHIMMMRKLQIVSNNNVSNLNLNNISDRVNIFQKFYTGYNLQ